LVKDIITKLSTRYGQELTINQIQRVTEEVLVASEYNEVAQAYISYRVQREQERMLSVDINESIKALTAKESTLMNENANKDSRVFNTQRDLTAGVTAKAIGIKMLSPHVANAHLKGQIHYHDLNYQTYTPMTNYSFIYNKIMIKEKFTIGNAQVDKPHSKQKVTVQMVQIIDNIASSQYVGTSANRIDEILAPYAETNYHKNLKMAQQWIDDEE